MTETIEKPATESSTTTVPITTGGGHRRLREPFAFIDSLQDELSRIWGQTWPLMPRPFIRPPSPIADLATAWAPRVDVFEKNGDIVVKAELPGVKREDVKLSIDDGDLVIEGERKAESEVQEKDYYRMERAVGSFYRRLPLPTGVKAEQVQASFADGVLEVRIPKPAEATPTAQPISIS